MEQMDRFTKTTNFVLLDFETLVSFSQWLGSHETIQFGVDTVMILVKTHYVRLPCDYSTVVKDLPHLIHPFPNLFGIYRIILFDRSVLTDVYWTFKSSPSNRG